MKIQVGLDDAANRLEHLIDQANAGEDVVIARNGRPVARLVPIERQPVKRVPGAWKGKGWTAPDFDETPEDVVDLFYEGPAEPK